MTKPSHSPGSDTVIGRYRAAIRAIFVLLVLALGFAVPALAAPTSGPFAAVVAVSGTPTVKHTSSGGPLTLRSSLGPGDIIDTGATGKVSILFSDGSQVRLGPGSRLLLTEPAIVKGRTSFIKVLAGQIWARLRPGRAVQTKYTNLAVRGTEINLLVAPDGTTTLTVVEGEVQFSSDFGEVIVRESQQSVVRPGSAPTKPVTVANTGLIVEWTLDLNRAELPREISWSGQTGASLASSLSQRDALARTVNTAENKARLGDALFDGRNFEGALTQYNLASTLAPGDAGVVLHRGYALLELGRLDDAAVAFSGGTPEARVGAAWVALERGKPADAEGLATQAVAVNAASAEAHLVLALALMRQPGREKEAEVQLKAMSGAQPAWMQPQAHAWLSILALSQDDGKAAEREATLAIKGAPNSALAYAAAASVAFYSGREGQAVKLANRAAELNPGSPATLIALSQAQLAQGTVEEAAATAARAVALDPNSAQAFYLLGVADAQRRDYRHSARELQTALRLSPDYFAAASLLARVYVRMGRSGDAMSLLGDLQKRHPKNDTLLAALGETLYSQGKYKEALEQYRSAVKVRDDSALAWNGLARVALDGNQLNEAIHAGQRATQLAPGVGTYHSTLGLAYTYSGLDRQAEREFRTALAYDPNNALALVQLGLTNREGDARFSNRTPALSYVQGFMLDPEVSRDLLRGGINTDVAVEPSNDGLAASLANQTIALNGDLHSYTNIQGRKLDGARNNDGSTFRYASNDTTLMPRKGTTIYFHGLYRRERNELPGTDKDPSPDDKFKFNLNEGILAFKQRMDDRATLWAGIFSTRQKNRVLNPNQDFSSAFITPGLGLSTNVIDQTNRNRSLDPEIRLDYQMGSARNDGSVFTMGMARPHNRARNDSNILFRQPFGLPSVPGNLVSEQNFPERIAYAQVAHRFGESASLIAQLRHVHYDFHHVFSGSLGPGILNFGSESRQSKSFWLPSMVGNLRVNERANLRLLAGRRKSEFTSSIFAPVATQVTTEAHTLPNGYPDFNNGDLHVYELDAEHRFGPGKLLKLYMFRSTGRNVVSNSSQYFNYSDLDNNSTGESNMLLLNSVKRSGVGVRYEHQLGRTLFGQAGVAYNRTTAQTTFFDPSIGAIVPAVFNGLQAPYSPRLNLNLGLNYISRSGYKGGLFMNHAGSMYADTDDPTATSRPRFGEKTTFDILMAREPSVNQEIRLRVNNIFNTRQIAYNGVNVGQRRVIVDFTRRF